MVELESEEGLKFKEAIGGEKFLNGPSHARRGRKNDSKNINNQEERRKIYMTVLQA
jgi:hypothetical protein